MAPCPLQSARMAVRRLLRRETRESRTQTLSSGKSTKDAELLGKLWRLPPPPTKAAPSGLTLPRPRAEKQDEYRLGEPAAQCALRRGSAGRAPPPSEPAALPQRQDRAPRSPPLRAPGFRGRHPARESPAGGEPGRAACPEPLAFCPRRLAPGSAFLALGRPGWHFARGQDVTARGPHLAGFPSPQTHEAEVFLVA